LSESIIEEGAEIGPFAYMRPQTALLKKSRVGCFKKVPPPTLAGGRAKRTHYNRKIQDKE